ncbi:MAG: ATP--guanido phosphotransferase, partial [Lachnospiraceae bacterium]|nr:ATP--guanido phosphotransferase [Lachnospiraceae bacterium]
MTKWYEETDQIHDVFVMKRLRLVRNIEGCIFPSRLGDEERHEMLTDMEGALLPVTGADGKPFDYMRLDLLDANQKTSLYERRVINYSRVEDKGPVGLALSADETMSVAFGGDDHLRLQLVSGSQSLDTMWKHLSEVDDLLGEKVPYAFDP